MKKFSFLLLSLLVTLTSCKSHKEDYKYVDNQLNEAIKCCCQINEAYATVSQVLNSANFGQLCEFAGWPKNYGSAIQIRANGTYNYCREVEYYLDNAIIGANKCNDKELNRAIESAREEIRRAIDESNLARNASSMDNYEKNMNNALSKVNSTIKQIQSATRLIKH